MNLRKFLTLPIALGLTAFECGSANVGCIASASAEVAHGCNWRLRQMTDNRPSTTHRPGVKAAESQEVADVIELAGKRKHER